MCGLFMDEGVLEVFPGKTASDLFVEIMTNKHYLSEEQGRDVGMMVATRDYATRFGKEPRVLGFGAQLSKMMLSIPGVREQIIYGLTPLR